MKMMQTVVFLGGMILASANDQAQCALDGAKSVSQMSDVAVFLWAASSRCQKPPVGNALSAMCEVDIASSIKAVNDMVLVIVSALKNCGAIHTENYKCGMAVGSLTSAAAGLAASSGGIVHDCPGINVPQSPDPDLDRHTNVGKCMVDLKDTVGSLFAATLKLSHVNKDCKVGSKQCALNALNTITAFSSMGSAFAGALNDCQAIKGIGNKGAACSQSVLAAVSNLHQIGAAGVKIAKECKADESRLFELQENDQSPGQGPMLLVLAAFIPASAVLSFVMGSRFAKSRHEYSPTREIERLVVDEQ